MTAKIAKDFDFSAGIHFEKAYVINTYFLTLYMDVNTNVIREQNIALERIKYMIYDCFSNCVFVEDKEKTAIDNYSKAGLKVCTLPEEPYDQIIASLLLHKFNSITNDKLLVTEITVKSQLCDDVEFFISLSEDQLGTENTHPNAWWDDPSTNICCLRDKNKEKIVQLKKESLAWGDLGLDWEEQIKTDNRDIVFTPLDKQ